ncbi:MAG: BsaWI family type II restriction enzyme, partial [Dehalococcoidia bacterium]
MTTDRVAQSLRTYGGQTFERIVAKILNSFLQGDNIVVARAKEPQLRKLITNESNLRQIMDFTKVPVKRRCDQSQLQDYPDLDLFALIKPQKFGSPWRLLAIINCKVSFHARHTEAAFWGLLTRLSSNIPFVVVTEDRDIYKPKA